ncbi:MAG: DUF971 domain-containing protein [Turneriella sp.]|nr:DUF971 domain-containing protein [Turneriella sp.]
MNPTPQSVELRTPLKPIPGNVVEINWSDGHKSIHSAFQLRLLCPCATCREQNGPRGVMPSIEVVGFHWVGKYALNFIFSDGHSTGIYTYRKLRECDESSNNI